MQTRIVLVALLSCAATQAWAQTRASPVVPTDRADQAPPKPDGAAPRSAATAQAVGAAVQPFMVRGVSVSGSSLPAAELETAWRPFVGQQMTGPRLVEITDALAAVYARHDVAIYTVTIPDQGFQDGVVQVRVLEGRLERVIVDGPPGRIRDRVEAYAAPLRAEQPLRRRTLERFVSLIRDVPGARADAQLETGSAGGGVVMRLTVRPRPVEGVVALSNRGTAYLARTQAQGDLYFNSAFIAGDQVHLAATLPIEIERFQSYALQYGAPLGDDGLRLSGSIGYLRTRPKGTELLGHATAAGLQLTYPLERSYGRNLYLSAGLDGVDSDNAFLGTVFADDRTRALRLAASYTRLESRWVNYASATVSQGLDILGARRTTPGISDLTFTKLNGRAGVSATLGERGALRVNTAGQWSPDRLPGTELFALGGEEFGRGYEAAVVAGDYGLAGSVELAFAPRGVPDSLRGSEAYGYVDGGKVWYRGRLGFPLADAAIASAGLGVRAHLFERALVQLEAARAFKDPSPLNRRRGWRGVVLVRAVF